MGMAKKCDICGKLYENYSVKKPIRADGRKVNALVLAYVEEDGEFGYNPYDAIDCCPDCMKIILGLIESLQNTANIKSGLESKDKTDSEKCSYRAEHGDCYDCVFYGDGDEDWCGKDCPFPKEVEVNDE